MLHNAAEEILRQGTGKLLLIRLEKRALKFRSAYKGQRKIGLYKSSISALHSTLPWLGEVLHWRVNILFTTLTHNLWWMSVEWCKYWELQLRNYRSDFRHEQKIKCIHKLKQLDSAFKVIQKFSHTLHFTWNTPKYLSLVLLGGRSFIAWKNEE